MIPCANGDTEEKVIKIYCVSSEAVCVVCCSTQRISHIKRMKKKTAQIVSSINVTTALKQQQQNKLLSTVCIILLYFIWPVCECVSFKLKRFDLRIETFGFSHVSSVVDFCPLHSLFCSTDWNSSRAEQPAKDIYCNQKWAQQKTKSDRPETIWTRHGGNADEEEGLTMQRSKDDLVLWQWCCTVIN